MRWGFILAALAAAVAFAIWRSKDFEEGKPSQKVQIPKKADSAEEKITPGPSGKSGLKDILKLFKKEHFIFNNLKIQGWAKHYAMIDHLLITKHGIIVFRDVKEPAKSVIATSKEWILETEKGEQKIKNPVNMNNYAISILRNVLKRKCKDIYDKINFKSVVLFDDSVKINSSLKHNKNAIVIKRNLLEDLIETILKKPEVLTSEEIRTIKEALS